LQLKIFPTVMKWMMFFALLTAASRAFGQACPNGDFENWSIHPYAVPDSGWYTSNPASINAADTPTVWVVGGIAGNAAHLQTAIVGTDTLAGMVANSVGNPFLGIGGMAYGYKPDSLTGYYRYNLAGNDTALLYVGFKKMGVMVGADTFKIHGAGSLSAFTRFAYAVAPTAVPDTVTIAAWSSNIIRGGVQSGSWLELDALAFTGADTPQTIPNGGMDAWDTTAYDKPTGWQILQTGSGPSGVSQSALVVHCNSYSIQMTTPAEVGNLNNKAMITNGRFTASGTTGGLPYTLLSDTIAGYYQYFPTGNDTGALYITLTAGGMWVATNYTVFTQNADWTYFEVPFSSIITPDTLRLDIVSGSGYHVAPGSTLYLDCMQLKSTLSGVAELAKPENAAMAYPDPATDVLHIALPSSYGPNARVRFWDVYGNAIALESIGIAPGAISFNVSALAPGFYFFEIGQGGGMVKGRFLKE
jgi:hypothetical protein